MMVLQLQQIEQLQLVRCELQFVLANQPEKEHQEEEQEEDDQQ